MVFCTIEGLHSLQLCEFCHQNCKATVGSLWLAVVKVLLHINVNLQKLSRQRDSVCRNTFKAKQTMVACPALDYVFYYFLYALLFYCHVKEIFLLNKVLVRCSCLSISIWFSCLSFSNNAFSEILSLLSCCNCHGRFFLCRRS